MQPKRKCTTLFHSFTRSHCGIYEEEKREWTSQFMLVHWKVKPHIFIHLLTMLYTWFALSTNQNFPTQFWCDFHVQPQAFIHPQIFIALNEEKSERERERELVTRRYWCIQLKHVFITAFIYENINSLQFSCMYATWCAFPAIIINLSIDIL